MVDKIKMRKLGGIFIVDPNLRIIQWSEGAATLLGVPVQEALGRLCYEIVQGRDAFGRQVCAPGCPASRALEQSHWSGHSSFLMRNRPGPPLRLQCELTALPSMPGGAVVSLYTSSSYRSHETEPKEGQSQSPPGLLPEIVQDLSALATLATSLSSKSLQENLGLALDILCEITGAEAAEVFLTETGRRGMVLACHRGLWQQAFFQITRFRQGEGFPGLVLEQQEPIVTSSLLEDPRFLRTRVKEKGFRSYVSVPFFGPEGVMGSLNVAFRHPGVDLNRASYLLSWAKAPLSMMLKASLLHILEVGNAISLDTDSDLEEDFSRVLNEILRYMVNLSGAQSGTFNLLDPKGKGIVRRVTEGPISKVPCPTLEAGSSQVCPTIIGGYGSVLHGPRKSWPLPCQHIRRLGAVTYCIPMLDRGITGLIQIAYQGFAPLPPTRDLVMLEEMTKGMTRTVRDAWRYLERLRRTEALSRQRFQMEISPSQQIDLSSPPKTAKTLLGKGHTATLYLDIRCFGPFKLFLLDHQITPDKIKRQKAIELLKILLTRDGRPLAKDTLIELLWPEVQPEVGANRLHVVMHALRKIVEPIGHRGKWVFVRNEGSQYYFNTQGPCLIDVKEFKTLKDLGQRGEEKGDTEAAINAYGAAVRLYRGDFLEDESFAEWCWMERENFRETCLNMLKRLAALHAEAGDFEQSVKHLRHAMRIEPVREEIHRELMRCLWANRRRDEALRQYEVCVKLLKRELDVVPLPETDRLVKAIRSSPAP